MPHDIPRKWGRSPFSIFRYALDTLVMRGERIVFLGAALATLSLGCKQKEETVVVSPAPAVEAAPEYAGTDTCTSCHEKAHEDWMGSHHDLAMQVATSDTVLGDFGGTTARYYGETAIFVREGDAFFVEVVDADGKPTRFPVEYAFGIAPLQQYLVETEPGRLQAFPFAWDTRPKERGGQRWFHLQPEEYIEPGDPLHWTGPSYNWNHACADCHSTALKKNYDRASKRYATEYLEVNVGCEACHGPGSKHIELAKAKRRAKTTGFDRRLPAFGERKWGFVEDADIAVLATGSPSDELETCAPCHSRRADLGGEHGGYHNRYRLAVLDEHLYFDDGQIKDEVYVYGSFLQSKMYAAGVVCSDCHEPHSATLRAEGNALCTRCHKAEVFDSPQHSFHEPGTPGSLCTDCHMPKRTYMVIDDRGDHRFELPRPGLSASVGAPDSCTGCHSKKTTAWAEREIAKHFESRSDHEFAEVLFAARHQQPGAEAGLVELVAAGSAPAIVRATALLELRNLSSRALPALLMRASSDPSPVVRRSVATAARDLPPDLRPEVVVTLLDDPVRTVRIEAVAALLGSNTRDWKPSDRKAFDQAKAEYEDARAFNADRGEGLVDLAYLATVERKPKQAEVMLREAIDTDPTFTAAYVNLADLYRSLGRDDDAETVLREAKRSAADQPSVEYALGLTLIRLGRHAEATKHLARAHELRPESIRFGYVYAVAQFDQGRQDAALRTLGEIHMRYPANLEILVLLRNYNRQLGRERAAAHYSSKLQELGVTPGRPDFVP
ncbi:MAG: tetratricopeptide repeat protein [Myxococcales bacterium]|nr:tetratricopeptide repeat protein [Myxococcales bacterium]